MFATCAFEDYINVKNRTNPWIDESIIKAMCKRDHYHRKAGRSNLPELWKLCKKERNKVVRMISDAQSKYYNNTIDISNNRNRDMWKSLNHIINIKKPFKC